MTRRQRLRRWSIGLGLLAVFLLSAWFTRCDPALFWRRRAHLGDIVSQLLQPEWSFAKSVLPLLGATIQMSVTGTGIGAFLALLLAPLCTRKLSSSCPVQAICRTLIQILRTFPALILALIATLFFGLGVFAGTVAIGIYTLAIMVRLTYEDVEVADLGAYRALLSMGAKPLPSYFRAVVPEILTSYLTNTLYLLESNVRHSAILGYVGAGGIGLLLNEQVSWRLYERVGTILLLLFVTVLVIEYLSNYLTQLVQGHRTSDKRQKQLASALMGICFLFCTLTLAPPDFSHTTLPMLRAMGRGLLQPDWSMMLRWDSSAVPYLLLETTAIAVVGTLLGLIVAIPLSFLGSARLLPPPVAWCFRTLVTAIRSVPFLIYGLILIRVSGPGAFTGVLTLAVCSVGLLCKRLSEAIDALDFRPYRALAAMGISLPARIRYGILPQLTPQILSAALYRFDINIREASILGLAGAGGIGAPLIFAMNQFAWNQVSALLLGLMLLVWLVDVWSGRCRRSCG